MTEHNLYIYREITTTHIKHIVVQIECYIDSDIVKVKSPDMPDHKGYLITKDSLTPLTESQVEKYIMLKLAGEDTSDCTIA